MRKSEFFLLEEILLFALQQWVFGLQVAALLFRFLVLGKAGTLESEGGVEGE